MLAVYVKELMYMNTSRYCTGTTSIIMSCETNLAGTNVKDRNDIVHESVAKNIRTAAAVLRSSQTVPSRRVDEILHQHVCVTDLERGAIDLHSKVRHRGVAWRERSTLVVNIDCRRIIEGNDILV